MSPEEERLTKKIEDEKAIKAALRAEEDAKLEQQQALSRELGLRVVALECAARVTEGNFYTDPDSVIARATAYLSFLKATQ